MNDNQPKKMKESRRPGADDIIVRLEHLQEGKERGRGNTTAMHERHTPETIQEVIEVVLKMSSRLLTITSEARALFRCLVSSAVSNGPA
jgi:hypothetical protein